MQTPDSARSDDTNQEEDEWESEDEDEDEDEDEHEHIKRKLNTASFGSLAKAQATVAKDSKKRKRSGDDEETEQKLDALRKRLKELQQEKQPRGATQKKSTKIDLNDNQDEVSASESDMDSENEEVDNQPKKNRSSKHAPMAMSSKKAVGRKRAALEVAKVKARDPRFDAVGGPMDHSKIRKNYGFLDSYVDDEIKELKSKLKEQKTPQAGSKKQKKKSVPKLSEQEVEELKRELIVKESKKKQQDRRDRAEEVIKEHKKKERELVQQGKTPYFMKNSDVKKQVLVKQFEGMSEGKRERLMEKRRKRVSQKERKGMPFARRTVD